MESAPVLALVLDGEGLILEANAWAQSLLGPELAGRPLAQYVVDFTHSLDLASVFLRPDRLHMFTLSLASGQPETYHFRFFPLAEGTLALGHLDPGEQARLGAAFLELNHELSNLTRQLHQANAELQDLNRLKNQFLGMAAHDLRHPLGQLLTYNGFLLDEAGPGLSAEHQGFLRICASAAGSMKHMIDAFLDVAVIESGHMQLDVAPWRLADFLAPVLALARLQAEKKGIELRLILPEGEALCWMDAPKLQQTLVNLLQNAIEHSRPGQVVQLSATQEPGAFLLSVRDEGPGLSLEEQARLFAPFARAGTRKTAGERSTGLGLAIARMMVDAHGGRLWVESLPGQGARFQLSIPHQEHGLRT
jgi:signal transduction histidine kinase